MNEYYGMFTFCKYLLAMHEERVAEKCDLTKCIYEREIADEKN